MITIELIGPLKVVGDDFRGFATFGVRLEGHDKLIGRSPPDMTSSFPDRSVGDGGDRLLHDELVEVDVLDFTVVRLLEAFDQRLFGHRSPLPGEFFHGVFT